jgi:hypothetical protein
VAQAALGQTAELLGSYTWSERDDRFGGLSALEITENGAGLVALSDRGAILTARVDRKQSDGRIDSVTLKTFAPLTNEQGRPLPELELDSEGLAITTDGRIFISFEAVHGIGEFDLSGRKVVPGLDRHPHFLRMQLNSSLEALAVDREGRLYTAPERSGRLMRPFPVYRRDASGWTRPFNIPRSEDYLLVGMDFGPDGRLYVLERALRGIFFAIRVRSFAVDGDRLFSERLVLEPASGTHDNLEGISVWRSDNGILHLSMVSDDNFNLFQRTQIVEYMLPGS